MSQNSFADKTKKKGKSTPNYTKVSYADIRVEKGVQKTFEHIA